MADTIVNTPAGNSDSGAAGWMVALIVLIAVIGGGFVWYRIAEPRLVELLQCLSGCPSAHS